MIIHDVHDYLLHGEASPKANPKQLLQRLLLAYQAVVAEIQSARGGSETLTDDPATHDPAADHAR